MVLFFFGTAALSGQPQDLAKLFPDIIGWQKKGTAEIFTPENLYEYIDGAAENFLNYDFKQLAVQNYVNTRGQALSAEIYFHGTAENAFGIYSSEKPVVGNYFELGSQGYAEAGILNFLCSAYYVKLSGFDLGSNDQNILAALGRALASAIGNKTGLPQIVRALASAIGNKTGLPQIVRAFPGAGKIANSERFILNNFLGHDFLHSAYTADYRVDGQIFQLFIMDAGSEGQARATLEKYIVLDKGKPVLNIQPGGLTINDPYNGPIRIFWRGAFICGCLGQTPAAMEYIAALAKNLPTQ
jgi:hypothetical protein